MKNFDRERVAQSSYANPKYLESDSRQDCNETFYIPMPSKNPIVRLFDYFCGLSGLCGYRNAYFSLYSALIFICGPVGILLPMFMGFHLQTGYNPDDWFCIVGKYCLIIAGISVLHLIFRIDLIYRYFRNKYLYQRNLPGPHGWGSIDYDSEQYIFL